MRRGSILSGALALLAGACALAEPPASAPAPDLFPAGLPGRFEVVGRGAVTATHSSDLWVFEGTDGRDYALIGTWGVCERCFGDRAYLWDVTDPARPVLRDSVMVDARVVNDVKVNAAGTLAVITREQASSRRNGIVVLDLSDPGSIRIASEYTETVTGGVHNTFIDGHLVYAVHGGTSDLHVLDVSRPDAPREIGRWGTPPRQGRTLHDVTVKDGLAYLSYWDEGLVVLDVGDGRKAGSPEAPQLVGQLQYRTLWKGREYGNTHVAVPYTNRAGHAYVFVGDEIFPDSYDPGTRFAPGGYVHVVDASDLESPRVVARYEVEGAGVHNLWVENDTLYAAYYNGGLRALDVSGELRGDLRAQGREIAALRTSDPDAYLTDAPFAWGPQVHKGHVFVSDFNSGLWIARLAPAPDGGPRP